MQKKLIALLSGGYDSALAIRIMQTQGFDVEGMNVVTPFVESFAEAKKCADDLGVPLHVAATDPSYVEIIKHPQFGYGKAANPCLDCHLFMLKMAKRRMEETGAVAVITGEVLGQRPMSQRRHHLEMLEFRSGLKGKLLRPISALRLPITDPEAAGIVDREQLYGFEGRARAPLHALGKKLGLTYIPPASPGCCLTQKSFAPRVFDLVKNTPDAEAWEFELLRHGRHIRLDETTRVIMGRDECECVVLRTKFLENVARRNWQPGLERHEVERNDRIEVENDSPPLSGRSALFHSAPVPAANCRRDVIYFEPETYTGPSVMLVGTLTPETLFVAKMLQVHYSKNARTVPEIVHRHFSAEGEFLETFVPVEGFEAEKYRPL